MSEQGTDRGAIRKQIRELKVERDRFLEAHDHGQLRKVRRKIHTLKRKARAAAV